MTGSISTETIPPGYWKDARGSLVPESKVKDIDKLRDKLVRDLCAVAQERSAQLRAFKLDAMQEVSALAAISMEQYGVRTGGDKGNITLTSFDGSFKVVRQMADHITFSEQLQAAKALIDGCVNRWAAQADDNIKALVAHAFQTDKAGKINTGRVLGLRQLDITDPDWLLAMQAIADSMQVSSTKPYIRFYARDNSGAYQPINLDVAAV